MTNKPESVQRHRSTFQQIIRQPYTIGLAATSLTAAVTLLFISGHPVKAPHSPLSLPHLQVTSPGANLAVVNEQGIAIPGAYIRSKSDTTQARTDRNGSAVVRASGDSPSSYTIEAPGYRPSELLIQPSELNPNIVISLRPETKHAEIQLTNSEVLRGEPYTQVFRSGPKESGIGREFGPWFQLKATDPRPGYMVDESNILTSLSGDRSCNSWSECRLEAGPTFATFSFRMQGHAESLAPIPSISEGILTVRYIPIKQQPDIQLAATEISADMVVHSLRKYISTERYPRSRTNVYWYIWLDLPDTSKGQIENVTYTFDPDYIRYPVAATINPSRGTARFGAVTCDSSGRVEVQMKSQPSVVADFNLCAVQTVNNYEVVPK